MVIDAYVSLQFTWRFISFYTEHAQSNISCNTIIKGNNEFNIKLSKLGQDIKNQARLSLVKSKEM